MRIAICTDQYLPMVSGLVDSIDVLASSLREEGHTVRIYTAKFPGAIADPNVCHFPAYSPPKSGGASVIAFPQGGLRDMRAFKPDVIHVHLFGVVGFFAIYASRRLGVPLVGTDHTSPADYLHYFGLNFPPFPFLVCRFASWFYSRCTFVTAPSQHILDELYDYGMRKTPSQVISNAVSLEHFRPLPNKDELKQKYNVGPRAVILFGRLALEKNLDFAIEVFSEVARRTQAVLVILGGGPYEEPLKQKIKSEGLESKVTFLGVLRGEELIEALNTAKVCFVTSTSEIQPMATLQAMAVGLPIVAARAGGLPECVIEGDTGFLIDPTDKDKFVEKIIELLDDEHMRKNFGIAGRKTVENYSPKEIAKRFIEVYQKANQ